MNTVMDGQAYLECGVIHRLQIHASTSATRAHFDLVMRQSCSLSLTLKWSLSRAGRDRNTPVVMHAANRALPAMHRDKVISLAK
jgi:hypothetical protein